MPVSDVYMQLESIDYSERTLARPRHMFRDIAVFPEAEVSCVRAVPAIHAVVPVL
jgi:hypothetical protein